jgi:polar amino acid transport system permease protein
MTPSLLTIVGFGPQGWGWQLAGGTVITVEISLGAYAVGILFGLAGAWARLSRVAALRRIAATYTTVIRAVPELLLIIVLFYSGTQVLDQLLDAAGWRGKIEISGFATAVLTLGFVQGAYMTEVLRGAIQAVPKATIEAAQALALRPWPVFRLVVFPMMLRLALPGMGNLWQSVIKESALVSVVGFSELLTVGKNAASETKAYLGVLCVTALIYYALTLISSIGFVTIERRLQRAYR